MTTSDSLVDELIAERRLEAFQENIKSGLQFTADSEKFRRVACHAYVGLSEVFQLSDTEAAELLGFPTERFQEWVLHDEEPMDAETIEKISCLLGIYKYLSSLYSGQINRMARWLRVANSSFEGRVPYEVLAGAGTSDFYFVRRTLAAMTV